MAKVLVSESNLTNIANAIRQKNGGSSQYTPAQMADAILAIQTGVEPWEINIIQSANQTISVNTSLSKTGTASYLFGESTDVPTVLATVTPSTGYNAGTASVQRSGNTFSVSASAATLKTYTVTIEQTSHQTITVTCNGTPHTTSFTASHGSTWTATIVADEGYNAGTLSATSGTLTDNIEISATPATVKIYNGASIIAGDINFGDEETFGYIDPVNDDPHSSMIHSVDGCEIYIDDETSQPVIISAFNSETGGGITLSVGSEDAGWFQQFGGYVNVFQHGFGGTVEQHIVQNLTMSSTSVNHVDNRHINIVTQNQFEYGLRYGIVFSGDTLTDEQLVSWYQEHGL